MQRYDCLNGLDGGMFAHADGAWVHYADVVASQPTLLNGLTEQETAASASVAGLSGAQPEAPAEPSADWSNRRTDTIDGWVNELLTLAEHPRRGNVPGFFIDAMRTIARGISSLATPAPVAAAAEPSDWQLNAITHVAAWLGDLQDVPRDASYWTNGRFAADCMDAHDVLLAAPVAQQPAELPEIDYDAAIKASGGKPGTWRCVSFANGARWYRDTAIKAQGGSQ